MEETQSPDPITSTRSDTLRYRRTRSNAPGHSKLSGILSRPQARRERPEQVELNEIITSNPLPGSNPLPFPDLENDMA